MQFLSLEDSSSTPLSATSILSVLLYNEEKNTSQTARRSGHPGFDSTNIAEVHN